MTSWTESIVNMLSLFLGWLIAMWIAQTEGFDKVREWFLSRGKK
jgi:hypothetical protein